MNDIARIEDAPQRRSITTKMAHRFEMEPDAFLATMVATVFARNMTREEQAAFLLVADHHNLNPVTREIYAMPKKGGGIIPVVSIDGWVRMSNEHPAFDGMEFEDRHDDGKLISTTCRIYRKDRSHPIAVTEYLSECRRETEPWKMEHRMLRHKSMIQCARYAFGFAGIYDPDEAERFAEPIAPRRAPTPVSILPTPAQIEQKEVRRAPVPPSARPAPAATATGSLAKRFTERAKVAQTHEELGVAWSELIEPEYDRMLPDEQDDLCRINRLRAAELPAGEGGGDAVEPEPEDR
jgi:phage recombination protein Bet